MGNALYTAVKSYKSQKDLIRRRVSVECKIEDLKKPKVLTNMTAY